MQPNQIKKKSTLSGNLISGLIWLSLIVVVFFVVLSLITNPDEKVMNLSQFQNFISDEKNVDTINNVKITHRPYANHTEVVMEVVVDKKSTYFYINLYGEVIDNEFALTLEEFKKNYPSKQFTITIVDLTQRTFIDYILDFLPIMLFSVIVLVVIYSMYSKLNAGNSNNKAFDFGKSKARLEEHSQIRFRDVAGCDDEKEELVELVDYLKFPRKYAKSGARIPKGVILKGPPGTGKTLLAKAVAGEASVPFYFISGSDFLEMFVGVGASRVRDMFKKARMTAPCIVFIDEIDAVARQRGTGLGGGHDEREQTLNQLLVEMDGFDNNTGIIVLAATNRVDVLDPALLRPGRFDRQISVTLPDLRGREEILRVHSRNKFLGKEVSLNAIAKRTPGFSGAELENVLNEAAILSVRNGHEVIINSDIDEAVDRVMSGPAKKSRIISEKARKLTAYHESGHAVVGLKVADAEVVQKITIIPRGDYGGYVLMYPEDESIIQTKGMLLAMITSSLAGRASEMLFFDDVTTGAYSDIEKATRIARNMVTRLGMSNLGPIQYEKNEEQVFLGRDYGSNKISGEVAFEIDKEVRLIIDSCLQKALEVIKENKDLLILIAETLLKYDTITAEEIQYLLVHGNIDALKEKQAEARKIEETENLETDKK